MIRKAGTTKRSSQKAPKKGSSTARRRLVYNPRSLEQVEVSSKSLASAVQGVFSSDFLNLVLGGSREKYRERILSIEVVFLALLDFLLLRVPSLRIQIDRIRSGEVVGVDALSFSASAFYKRLRKVSHEVFLDVLQRTTKELDERRTYRRQWVADLAPFAAGIYAIDDTTLDALMRKTKSLKRHVKGDIETLGGRLGCALDLTTGAFAEVLYDSDAGANEKTHIRPLIDRFDQGSLYVFDLGYFAFPLFDYITEHEGYFITRLRNKATYKVIQTLVDGRNYRDQIVYLGKHRADRAAHPVRLVEFLIDRTWYRYITNVLDPRQLPAPNLWALYSQRWAIEMAFAAVKRSLGLAYLHPCHRNGMLIQIWCTLTVYQVLQDLRLEIAAANGWAEEDVSWQSLVLRIGWYVTAPHDRDKDLRTWLVQDAESLFLKKRGVRKRRRDCLPAAVHKACSKNLPPLDADKLKPQTPRQGSPAPRKKKSDIIVAELKSSQR